MKNITTALSATVKHCVIGKNKTLVWFEACTNSGRNISSRRYLLERVADRWRYQLEENEMEVSENAVVNDFLDTYKNFLTMADMIDGALIGIKEGFLS